MLDKTFAALEKVFDELHMEADELFEHTRKLLKKSREKYPSNMFGGQPFYSETITTLKTKAPKYEYKVVEVHLMAKESGDIETYLNKLGEEGWQMVQNDGGRATFMREKGEEEDE